MNAGQSTPRLLSLDAFRGFIMVCLSFNGFGLAKAALLHLEQEPNSRPWQLLAAQWEHGEWVGCSFWDLIMPAFLFMVGAAMPFSYSRRQAEGHSRGKLLAHALSRSAALILLGIFLVYHNLPGTPWSLMNTLTQIGLCYPWAYLCWDRGWRVPAAVAAAALALTWVLYAGHGGSPELGPGVTAEWAAEHQDHLPQAWRKNANIGQALDVRLLNWLPQPTPFIASSGGYQTLNFLPSLATMLIGLMCGQWLRGEAAPRRKFQVLLAAGAGLVLAGWLWGVSGTCPVVKRLWTPSFALLSAGWCVLMQAGFLALIDLAGWRRWCFPLVVAGANSLALYCMSMLLKPWVGRLWQRYLGPDIFLSAGPLWEPVLRSCAVGLTFWLVCYWMYRNKLFVRL